MSSLDSNISQPPPLNPRHEIPPWVTLMAMPVWVVGSDGNIAYINGRAEKLLGKSQSECIGQPCHDVIGGKSPAGVRYCGDDCPVRRSVRREKPIEPISFVINGADGEDCHAKVVVIVTDMGAQQGQQLVHCIVDESREHKMRKYVETVRRRSPHREAELMSLEPFHLSDREKEILRLLAADETLHGIAHKLSLSYATVRNHVQHLLTKLGVHSILEAVAVYLLADEG
jgi:DNA-binding CsgD family transcriptional regulator